MDRLRLPMHDEESRTERFNISFHSFAFISANFAYQFPRASQSCSLSLAACLVGSVESLAVWAKTVGWFRIGWLSRDASICWCMQPNAPAWTGWRWESKSAQFRFIARFKAHHSTLLPTQCNACYGGQASAVCDSERQAPTPLARKACELWGRQAARAWATLVARKCHHAIYYLGLGRLSRSRTPAPPLHLLAFGLRCIHVSFHVADACNYTSIVYSCQNTRTFRQLWFTVWPRKLRPGQLVVCTFAAGRVAL